MPRENKLRWGPDHVNSNVMCAIDIRRGGEDADNSDLLEVCFLPVGPSYKLSSEFKLCQIKMRPSWRVDTKVARVSKEHLDEFTKSPFDAVTGFSIFERWFATLDLREHKKIIPLVWDWARIRPFLVNWMGPINFAHHIDENVREARSVLNFINDRADISGQKIEFVAPKFSQFLSKNRVELIDTNSVPANCDALIKAWRASITRYV